MEGKFRNWQFVINNFTDTEEQLLKEENFKYLIYQIEKGEEGTPHIQATIIYKSQRTLKGIKKTFPRAHLDKVENLDESIKYSSKPTGCWKDTNKFSERIRGPYEFGDKPKGQGNRSDLDDCYDMIKNNIPMEEIADAHPGTFIRYNKGLTAVKNLHTKHRTEKSHNTWIWGKSGTGKTSSVINKHGADNVYIKDGTIWWDGYNNQEAILIDDFDGKWEFRNLLRLLDYTQYQGQIKGGYVKINSPFIYITCEFEPSHYYGSRVEINSNIEQLPSGSDNKLAQIVGRLDEIIHKEGENWRLILKEQGKPK